MKISDLKFKISLILLSTFYFLLLFNFSFAQTIPAVPQFLVNWQARTFVPSWYAGKILPTNQTPVDVFLEVVVNGKQYDLSNTKIRWYINDTLFKNEANGMGIKKITFFAPDYAGGSTAVRIQLFDYPSGGTPPEYTIIIPVVAPEAIISAPYPNNSIGVGSSFLRATPFFFSGKTNNLSVAWNVDGQAANSLDGDPFLLNLNVDQNIISGKIVNIAVSFKNLFKQVDFANGNINLTVNK